MTVSVAVRTYTHSITYVTDNILKSLKDIIVCSGLDPDKFVSQWDVLHDGIKAWITSGHLRLIILEVYDPSDDELLGRWDVEMSYAGTDGDGEFWVDTDAIRYAVAKAGIHPWSADYAIKVTRDNGFARVDGWTSTTLRSTSGFVQQRIGTTVENSGLGGSFSYYRRT
jgi:hypothetical protein